MSDFVWVEKYRPTTIKETILPEGLKKAFQQFVDQGEVPNLLLSGSAGVGKTTVAKALLNEIGADYIVLNGSNEGRKIDFFREQVKNFASTVSFSGGRKFIIIDEADYMSAEHVQPLLRHDIEAFSKNCGFILTCNFKNRIIDPLQSRCSVVDFKIPKEEKPYLLKEFYLRIKNILETENVEYDNKVLGQYVQKYFPDFRRAINELQRYSGTGRIDTGILSNASEEKFDSLIGFMKNKNFTEVRKWVALNTDIDSDMLYRALYDILPTKIKSQVSIAHSIIILAEYQYKEAFSANPEINRTAALATLMAEMDWA